jgi:hypothetical protein
MMMMMERGRADKLWFVLGVSSVWGPALLHARFPHSTSTVHVYSYSTHGLSFASQLLRW